MENYLMYLRKSRQDSPFETVEEVLARHETILQDFARRTLGYTIPEENIYREVVSGETIEKRPEMQTITVFSLTALSPSGQRRSVTGSESATGKVIRCMVV